MQCIRSFIKFITKLSLLYIVSVWILLKRNVSAFHAFFSLRSAFQCFPVGPVYYLWDPQTSFFNKTFIKNGSYSTIHTFKNYFATVFSVFSFEQNKRYSVVINTMLQLIYIYGSFYCTPIIFWGYGTHTNPDHQI